jgi:hypothetical protein
MDTRTAVIAYGQSEKIKSGLIWISQLAEMVSGLRGEQRIAGESIIQHLIGFIASEANLAKKIAHDHAWEEIETHIEKARVMLHSGVLEEVTRHLTQALSRTTGIGQKSMSFLIEHKMM